MTNILNRASIINLTDVELISLCEAKGPEAHLNDSDFMIHTLSQRLSIANNELTSLCDASLEHEEALILIESLKREVREKEDQIEALTIDLAFHKN